MATIVAHFMGDPTEIPYREEAKRLINVWRSTLIRQSLEKNPLDRRFFRQTIYRELVLTTYPSELGTPKDEIILRTNLPVPMPLRANNIFYDHVTNFNFARNYPLIDLIQVPTFSHNKWIGRRPYAVMLGDYLYLHGEKVLSTLAITGIFDSLNLDDCNHDEEYPCPLDIQQRILQVIEQEVLHIPKIKNTEISIAPTPDGIANIQPQ